MTITDYTKRAWGYFNNRPKWTALLAVGVSGNYLYWGFSHFKGFELDYFLSQVLLNPFYNGSLRDDFKLYWLVILLTVLVLLKTRDIDQTQ